MFRYGHGFYPGMWGFGFPWMILWWLFVVALVLAVFWGFRRVGHGVGSDREALEIAKRRYARGEITAEELKEIRKNLHED